MICRTTNFFVLLLSLATGCGPSSSSGPGNPCDTCTDGTAPDGETSPSDATLSDTTLSDIDGTITDVTDVPDGAPVDVEPRLADGGLPVTSWALYTISPGAHSAMVSRASVGNPLAGLVRGQSGRDYYFAFDRSAQYEITHPTEPSDQLDWNKLPGLSDCNGFDLAQNGVMFAWRWRLDRSPRVLEITAYANDSGRHLWPDEPLVTLDADDLASVTPLRYRFWADGARYHFAITGTVRERVINAETTLARQCPETNPKSLTIQWAAGFYFGGTSTAPSTVTGRVFEVPFRTTP